MKHSLRDGGGYLEIDHRDSPGLTPADVAHVPGALVVGKGEHFETDVYQCSHCQRAVMHRRVHTNTPPAVCPKCYHQICQGCERMRVASGGACVPFKAVLERAASLAATFTGQPDHPDAAIDVSTLSAPGPPRVILTDVFTD